jgi:hypothetical protein
MNPETDFRTGTAVVLFLQDPKEKFWGALASLGPAGVAMRGLDLDCFEEWLHQEARGEEKELGPLTFFFPMHRVVRLERDETVGPVLSYSDRVVKEVGREVREVLGLSGLESPLH